MPFLTDCLFVLAWFCGNMLTGLIFSSASSLGMMSDEEKKLQRIEDIRELLS